MAQAPHPRMHGLTHIKGGSDPIPLLPAYPTGDITDKIMQAAPAAFWKLDETTGTVAHDSSGNHHDLKPQAGSSPPVWVQETAPTGGTSAEWVDDTTKLNAYADVAMGAFTDNFSAGVWAKFPTSLGGELIGQGTAYHGGAGWALMMVGAKPAVLVAGTPSYGNDDLLSGTWYFLAVVRETGVWKLYVDGLLQAATQTTNPSSPSSNTWLGNDAYASHSSYLHGSLLSYAFLVDRAMSGTELLSISAAGATADTPGLVLGIDDEGNPAWVQPKVEVTVNGEAADTTPNPPPDPVPPPDTGGPDGASWIQDQPFTWGGPTFQVPPNKWTTIPFSSPLMERQSTPSGGATTWYELDWDDPDAAGWIDPATPRVITVPHDIPFDPGNSGFWLQICLKLETPPVEDEIFVEGDVTRGSHRGLRVFETTHQKSVMEAFNWRGACCDEHGAIDVFRDPTKHPGLLGDANMFALGDPGGDHNLEHGNIMIVPNSGYGYYLPGADWLPGHATGNPVLKKGMRLVPQVWHNASTTLTFDCTGVLPYRPHFVLTTPALRSWGPPWSGWPT